MSLEGLSKIYYQKYARELVPAKQKAKEYHVYDPQETTKLIAIYTLRNNSYKKARGEDNPGFIMLIKDLEAYKERSVIMHILDVNNIVRMVLTNIDCTEVVSELEVVNRGFEEE